jgi:hypothetical protein
MPTFFHVAMIATDGIAHDESINHGIDGSPTVRSKVLSTP